MYRSRTRRYLPRSLTTVWCALIIIAALLLGLPLQAEDDSPPSDTASDTLTADNAAGVRSIRDAIEELESRDGAYAAGLPEQMLSLGLALQQQERHEDALGIFKRGVHLARINDGLKSLRQVPLLEGQIKSAVALGQYSLADELQQTLYRVQVRDLAAGEQRAAIMLQQANWQFNAFKLGLEPKSGRLVNMWDLYYLAWSDIGEAAGKTSPKLLPPLYGLLQTQYLVTQYQAENEPVGHNFNANPIHSDLNQFYVYRSQNYELGKSVILSIYNIQRSNLGQESSEAVDALVKLGDWALWNKKYDQANDAYRHALTELALNDDAKELEQRLFATPVPLPDIKGLSTLPKAVSADKGNILVEFAVDERGKVSDLVRLDTNEESTTQAEQLMRVLRATKFRPRFEAGQPTGTAKLVRAYDIKP